MKVKELIHELAQQDGELEVEIEVNDERWATDGLRIEEVFYDRPTNRYCCIII